MLSFSRKISCCQPFCYYIAQVLTMCLPCALASWGPIMGPPCALACWTMGISCQPSWISSFYIFWYVQFEMDLGVPCTVSLSLFAGPEQILRRFSIFAEEPCKSTITVTEPCNPVFKEAQPRPS